MLKASFKDNFKKVEKFNGRVTIVTLIGRVKMPERLNTIPLDILDWACMDSGQDVNLDYSKDMIIITIKGKTVRAEGDADNPILAERIAESRAKIKLYKFMITLCNKLRRHYHKIQYGKGTVSYHVDHLGPSSWGLLGSQYKYDSLLTHEQMHLNKLLIEA